jgi:hypothetical protein
MGSRIRISNKAMEITLNNSFMKNNGAAPERDAFEKKLVFYHVYKTQRFTRNN